MNEYKFNATLKSVTTDQNGNGKVTVEIPLVEMKKLNGLNLEIRKAMEVQIKVE